MHPNPAFRKDDTACNLDFAHAQGFGMLSINAQPAPLLAHIPFLINRADCIAELHLVRSNPIARAVNRPTPAVIAVQGPHGYVSPDWYGLDDQVPTWNYIAVHLRGELRPLPSGELRRVIDALSDQHEQRLHPKPIWRSSKMDPAALDKMMRQIVPFAFDITAVDATWKLNQNKPDAARLGAADKIGESCNGMGLDQLADLMRDPP